MNRTELAAGLLKLGVEAMTAKAQPKQKAKAAPPKAPSPEAARRLAPSEAEGTAAGRIRHIGFRKL